MIDDPLDIALNGVIERKEPIGPTRKLLKYLEGDDYLLQMDWSSIECFTECDRMAFFKLIHSRSTYQQAALTYGAAIHNALEYLYRNSSRRHDPGFALEMAAVAEPEFIANPVPLGEWRTFDFCKLAIAVYLKEYFMEPFTVATINNAFAVELPFAYHMGEININELIQYPRSLLVADCEGQNEAFYVRKIVVDWTGIIDLVIEHNNQLKICDHKTTSVVGDSYFKSFELSTQLIGYVWAARNLIDASINSVLLNCIAGRKPTKTGKSHEPLRRFYQYSRDKINGFQDNMLALIKNFMSNVVEQSFPMKTSWCVNKFGTCPFFDVCTQDTDVQMNLLYSSMYARNTWNPIKH